MTNYYRGTALVLEYEYEFWKCMSCVSAKYLHSLFTTLSEKVVKSVQTDLCLGIGHLAPFLDMLWTEFDNIPLYICMSIVPNIQKTIRCSSWKCLLKQSIDALVLKIRFKKMYFYKIGNFSHFLPIFNLESFPSLLTLFP